MTGFGRGRRETNKILIEIEVRSVNHRFLTLQFRIPADFSILESELEERARRRVQRGSLSVNITIRRSGAQPAAAVVDLEQARAVAAGLRALAKELKLSPKISVETIAAAPGVLLNNRTAGPPDDELKNLLIEAFDEALSDLVATREREGESLANDLRGRVDLLRRGADTIETLAPKSVAQYYERLKKRVEELLGEQRTAVKDTDLARELALLAEKSDVAEEVARLRTHVEELDGLLQKREPVGRRIDFLLQEMGREVNTTGSKSLDTDITRIVMDLKAELERIREQSANFE